MRYLVQYEVDADKPEDVAILMPTMTITEVPDDPSITPTTYTVTRGILRVD